MNGLWPDDIQMDTMGDGTCWCMGSGQYYCVSGSLLAMEPDILSQNRAAITRYVMENAGDGHVQITSYNIKSIISRLPKPVSEKVHDLLYAMAKRTDFQAIDFDWSHEENTLFYALIREAGLDNIAELRALLII